MWVARVEDGYLFGDLTPTSLETLRGVPMLLESKDERVRARLLPETYADHDSEDQWREHTAPELERLFVSRTVIVRKDLDAMRQWKPSNSWVLKIPDTHANAWLATLNAARLALYVLNDMTAEHLERGGHRKCTAKQREAAERIQFLAEIQSVLLGEVDFEGDDEDLGDDPTGQEKQAD